MKFDIPDKYTQPVLIALIVISAGPEIFAASELIALLEIFGTASFILLYLYAIKAVAFSVSEPLLRILRRLDPLFPFIPTWQTTKQMPSLLIHALPLHTVSVLLVIFMFGALTWQSVKLLLTVA